MDAVRHFDTLTDLRVSALPASVTARHIEVIFFSASAAQGEMIDASSAEETDAIEVE
jgi:hypothetical protein